MNTPMQSVDQIRQDAGDNDCGPTCAAFLRYGGLVALESQMAPSEAVRIPVTRRMIQKMDSAMREGAIPKGDEGVSSENVKELLNHWAAAWEEKRFIWARLKMGSHGYAYESWNNVALAYQAGNRAAYDQAQAKAAESEMELEAFLDKLNSGIAAGCGRGLQVTLKFNRDPKGIGHSIVFLASDERGCHYYDPDPRSGGICVMPPGVFLGLHLRQLHDYWATHGKRADYAYVDIDPIFDRLTVKAGSVLGSLEANTRGNKRVGEPELLEGEAVCVVSSGVTFQKFCVDAAEPIWYGSHLEADGAANSQAAYANKKIAVIECTRGAFALVEVTESTGNTLKHYAMDQSSSSQARAHWRKLESIRLSIPGKDNTASANLILAPKSGRFSHRTHDWFK